MTDVDRPERMNAPLKPLPTRYAGCHFRSRLEARWAVFFDHLDVRWNYEPDAFRLPHGSYLPDFWLPDLLNGCYFEVKPDNADEDLRWSDLVVATSRQLIVAFGMPHPTQDLQWGSGRDNGWMEIYGDVGWDNGRAFCVCPTCDAISIEFEGRSGRMTCCGTGAGDYPCTADHPRILAAYTAAHSARFGT